MYSYRAHRLRIYRGGGGNDKAVSDFDALQAGLGVPTFGDTSGGKASGGKPFVLLSALLALDAIASAVQLYMEHLTLESYESFANIVRVRGYREKPNKSHRVKD